MKVSIYLRCSTIHQDTGAQKRDVEAYCQRQGWKICKVYEDAGVSGAKGDRPALNQMLADVRKGNAGNIIVVYKIDRLARSVADLLRILTELTKSNVGFCSATQGIDTSTSYGRMVLTFLGAIAEFEREVIVERVRSGLTNARAKGIKLGRPKTVFDTQKALKMKQDGLSWAEIHAAMNVPVSTIRRILTPLLKNPSKPSH